MRNLRVPLLLLVASVAACAYRPNPKSDEFRMGMFTKSTIGALEKQATFDFQCEAGLEYQAIAGGTVGVVGCDKRAVYKYVESVGWVMNSSSFGSDTGPAPDA